MRTRQEQKSDTQLRRRVLRTPGLTFKRLGEILDISTQAAERITLPPGHPRRIRLSLEKALRLRAEWPDFSIETYDQPADRPARSKRRARA